MRITIILLSFLLAFGTACKKDEKKSSNTEDNFDRKAMLENYADNIIVPNIGSFQVQLNELVISKDSFIQTPNISNLVSLRNAWEEAYTEWQWIEMYNIGKAEEILYNFQMNIYPTNKNDILNNITKGSYDLTHPNNNDAVGFPALDFMLFGIESTDTLIINKYASENDAEQNKKMLSDLVNQMSSLTQNVLDDWNQSYRDLFVNSTGNTASSAVNKLINDYIFYVEKGLRANKFGIPAGNFSSTPLPDKVEAYYHQNISKKLSLEAIKATKNTFNGISKSGIYKGESLYTYLVFLGKTDLANEINDQFDIAEAKIGTLNDNFYTQVTTDNTKMTESYDAIQKIVILLKLDMLQALNVRVDYVDADGD